MKLTVSTPEQRRRQTEILRNRKIERAGLLGATTVLVLALLLVSAAKRPGLTSDAEGLAGGRIVNLSAVRSSSEVLPLLDYIDDSAERGSTAQTVFDFVRERQPLSHIGLLSSVPLTAADLRELKRNAVVRTPEEYGRRQAAYAMLVLLSFWTVHLAWSRLQFRGDGLVLPAMMLLCSLGFVMMISIRDPLRDTPGFAAFAQGVAVGCALLLAVSLFDFQKSQLRRLAFVPLLGSFLLSLLLFVFGSGPGTSDARINLFGFQPVEAIKILLVFFLAGYFAEHWELIRELRQKAPAALGRLARLFNLPPMQYIVPITAGVAAAVLFFVFQKDLGPGLILSLLFLVYYGVARGRIVVVLLGLVSIVGAFWLVTALGVSRTVATRVAMWESPWRNFALSGGDHLGNSLWAFASGGIQGSGLGLGKPDLVQEVATDFILAGIGEDFGFLGILSILLLYGLLLHRSFRAMQRSPGDYSFFLCLGMMTVSGLQILLIGGGVLGLVPLSGVTTPFLSYGRSSLLASFVIFGVILSVSSRANGAAAVSRRFERPVRVLAAAMGLGFAALVAAAFNVQVLQADRYASEAVLAYQADGQHRLTYNPRLLQAASEIPRGTIYDRNGIPLATSRFEEIAAHRDDYRAMGIDVERTTSPEDSRHYPFGGVLFHLLGDTRTEINWRASNTSYIERDYEAHLRGFDDHPVVERLSMPSGKILEVERHDYSALIPLLRHAGRPDHPAVKALLEKNRDLHTTIDVRLQMAASELLQTEVERQGKLRGAAVILDAATGDVLASVSYPWPGNLLNAKLPRRASFNEENQFDRARYGLYPPGSTFKVVTAMAALNESPSLANHKFMCRKLPDGRVGTMIAGFRRPVRDDIRDTHPHGEIDLAQGLIVSCNAYYAQLGVLVGAQGLLEMASALGIAAARPNDVEELRLSLPEAAYGQGEVLASPFQMARVAAAIAASGKMPFGRWVTDAQNTRAAAPRQVIPAESARFLAKTLRAAVTDGTGSRVRRAAVPIAGKTGTAEVTNGISHSWFVGFAPYAAEKPISFSVIIENGGYGGGSAATVAGQIVDQARKLKIVN